MTWRLLAFLLPEGSPVKYSFKMAACSHNCRVTGQPHCGCPEKGFAHNAEALARKVRNLDCTYNGAIRSWITLEIESGYGVPLEQSGAWAPVLCRAIVVNSIACVDGRGSNDRQQAHMTDMLPTNFSCRCLLVSRCCQQESSTCLYSFPGVGARNWVLVVAQVET
jgi:hypothetical protein